MKGSVWQSSSRWWVILQQRAGETFWELSEIRFMPCPLNLRFGPSVTWSWENQSQKPGGASLPSVGGLLLFLCPLPSPFSLHHLFINSFSDLVLIPPWRCIFILNGKARRRGQNNTLTLNSTFWADTFLCTFSLFTELILKPIKSLLLLLLLFLFYRLGNGFRGFTVNYFYFSSAWTELAQWIFR